ncbi:hypothetical protein K490DRAFT_58831 [Saccharata proteae CBS 121410]|uniref:Saccharopine dehydrogenase NADP binding domain-containing protein n=1 Tax=Saccharata proteae CBS 121410 TaxID=1314787 RepID=A0A9P4LWL4_9PEZI|nr:hypothetical protein K490DRAFT_58831 [Saccharata proteae CBS 121410]
MSQGERKYELVLLGATGYTGKLTAEHIATNLPTNLNWAIAGRNEQKLSSVAHDLRQLNPDRIQPDIEVVELKDDDLNALCKKAKLVITTVGPFMKYGEPVVRACAENGTHYVDSTGEVPWVLEMIEKYHDKAQHSGAIMIPQCGVDSVPADIAAYVVSTHLRRNFSVPTSEVLNCLVDVKSKPSGGTLSTVISLFDHYPLSQITHSLSPFALSPVQPSAVGAVQPSLATKLFGVRWDKDAGVLTDWVQAAPDTAIVLRSWGLLGDGQGGQLYGPRFRFSEWMVARNSFTGAMVHFGLALGMGMLLLPPARWALSRMVTQPGFGPEKELRDTKGDFVKYKAIGIADSPKQQRASTTFEYTGSMYSLTGLTMAEAAMVILRGSDYPAKALGGGILTPATLGDEYVDRLRKTGVTMDTVTL